MNILIADDNKQILSILSNYAKKEGYAPLLALDGEQALDIFNSHDIDIVLLDVMMPKLDGFSVCREIRKVSNVPVIMVTARGEDYERIMGLDNGADDYIIKPFSPAEVMARIRAIMRRIDRGGGESTVLEYDNLRINMDEFQTAIDGQPVSLTKKEMELLWLMASNRNKVFTRENLLDSIWGFDYYGDSRTVDSHIKRLRAKLDAFNHPAWSIETVWGQGYKFEDKTDEA